MFTQNMTVGEISNFSDEDFQLQIINEIKTNNSQIEMFRHVLSVSGSMISIFGILGNLISLFILFKPGSMALTFSKLNSFNSNLNKPVSRRNLGSFEYKLSSFYAYLKALSLCDFFSCIFAILNILQYIIPPSHSQTRVKYSALFNSMNVYTLPIATTLQALSIWIICAFSINRCRSILKPSALLSSFKKEILKKNVPISKPKISDDHHQNWHDLLAKLLPCFYNKRLDDEKEELKRDYFFQISFKNNLNNQGYTIKFYKKSIYNLFRCFLTSNVSSLEEKHNCSDSYCSFCFCTCAKQTENEDLRQLKKDSITSYNDSFSGVNTQEPRESEIAINPITNPTNPKIKVKSYTKTRRSINRTRYIIISLYLLAFIYLIPQLFEKHAEKFVVENNTYFFVTMTKFGESRLYRHLYHLWFYLFAINIIPFVLIFISNLLLLRVYLKSKKRCQRYHIRASAVLRDFNSSSLSNQANSSSPTNTANRASSITTTNTTIASTSKSSVKKIRTSLSPTIITSVNESSRTSNLVNFSKDLPDDQSISMRKSDDLVNEKRRNSKFRSSLKVDNLLKRSSSVISNRSSISFFTRRYSQSGASIKMGRKSTTNQINSNSHKPSRSLTLTLFGVAFIFLICNLPAAIGRIIYVVYPEIEFKHKELTSIYIDIANFLIMLNSSTNFILYIVFGPGRFREEFRIVCLTILNKFICLFRFFNLFNCNKNNESTLTTKTTTNDQKNTTTNKLRRSDLSSTNQFL